MKQLFRVIEKVAQDDVPVLVRGETGTGKELVATALHLASPRRDGPFRAINCAALPPNLLESELFGHARGAFTGAIKAMPGHMQLAHVAGPLVAGQRAQRCLLDGRDLAALRRVHLGDELVGEQRDVARALA